MKRFLPTTAQDALKRIKSTMLNHTDLIDRCTCHGYIPADLDPFIIPISSCGECAWREDQLLRLEDISNDLKDTIR